jgi:2-keto-4-pentenoate hydratase/2-oxohepta-3-ene-1,7-dioic acid hydratase in catechol pathway
VATIGRFQKGIDIFHAKVIDGELFRVQGNVFAPLVCEQKPMPSKGVRPLIPVVPSKVIVVGFNYADQAHEAGEVPSKEPFVWLKAPSSLIPDGASIEIPFASHRTDFGGQLAIVIGRQVSNIKAVAAAKYIFGYMAAQDINDRTLQDSR